ncbi:MAG: hypothetical protein IPO56_09160 [Flavobacteriales bacterium]|nr:hypothetical protein [Flavobacteriales bacterium]
MSYSRIALALLVVGSSSAVQAQKKAGLPDVSSTLKGNLILPVPLGNPLLESVTESVGQLDAALQFPIAKGFGLGFGGKMTWFTINERALAPVVTSGEIRRAAFYGKLDLEQYTGERTFYELNLRMGVAMYNFDCSTCPDGGKDPVLHWGIGTGYYVHATDNLAFGLTLGYETDGMTFGAPDLGLEGFPGRPDHYETRRIQYLIIGMGFSTRLRKAPDNGRGW